MVGHPKDNTRHAPVNSILIVPVGGVVAHPTDGSEPKTAIIAVNIPGTVRRGSNNSCLGNTPGYPKTGTCGTEMHKMRSPVNSSTLSGQADQ